MHRDNYEPKQETDQATLARVKKEMDEPRMTESTRKEVRKLDRAARNGIPAVIERGKD